MTRYAKGSHSEYKWALAQGETYTPPKGWEICGHVRCCFQELPRAPRFSVLLKRTQKEDKS